MKQGKTLTQLAVELERQQNSKKDYVADTRMLAMNNDGQMEVRMPGNVVALNIRQNAHNQMAEWAKIPKPYYDRMPNDLRAHNVNYWLEKNPAKRLVRALDGSARAFLSDRYRPLDNFDLAEAVLPILAETPDMRVESSEITENRMYIKALFPRLEREVTAGDIVQSGVVISNSETGHGSLKVEPLVFRLSCLNGLISNIATRKHHVGKSVGAEGDAFEIYRPETMAADDRAFWMKVQDTVRASVSEAGFDHIVEEMRRTNTMMITGDPVAVVERVQKRFGMTDKERGGVLNHLIQGGSMTAYGLLNALTRTSQDIEDYDRATDFERMGGQIIELKREEWTALAQAA